MSVSRVGDKSRRKKGRSAETRRGALKDALPDAQPPSRIKRVLETEEPAAENDEEDD